ncbi:TetR family transcriptional regulator [Planotetraspora kaengkrachanensis]|uniref:HTH-type transcriptional repressor n=1 Tax=Planotetraspora kaengkrachanensis TaxID=575193 RepID=A0A8J3M5R2_9ACTN|nr:TetR family transcriptional regulator [Planotetraspora kaengkrachanensis]GIG77640.1 HTH-type transcriptional repressor [Planotetraspora kaengkrachanensis]
MSKAEATRERILDAALEEFSTFGVAGARVDRIAHKAGCNKNLIYIYFESKEKLFTTLLQRHLADVNLHMPFTADDLPGFAGKVYDFATAHPEILRLLAWSTLEQSAQLPETRAESFDYMAAAVIDGQREGRIDPGFEPEFLVTTLMAIATAWSPALPFGTSTRHPAPEVLRDNVVKAVTLLVRPFTDVAVSGPGPETSDEEEQS